MKKSLLLVLSMAGCVASVSAQYSTPRLVDNASVLGISADGHYAVSEVYGIMTIFDLENNTEVVLDGTEEGLYYSVGNGNFITADGGVIVGSTSESTDAAYFDGTQWHQLPVPDATMTNIANGITPDAKRICGSVAQHAMTINEDVLMQAPAYWDLQADGTYSEAKELPYPKVDPFGATPQYVMAISISDDGKTIIGQLTDSRGAFIIPVLFTEGADGEWNYSYPMQALFNPSQVELPENPGEGPKRPSEEEYMTAEEIAAYDAALQEYFDSGYTAPYPSYNDFMSEEESAEYEAALAVYNAEYEVWNEKYMAWDDAYYQILAESPTLNMNQIYISGDGKTMGCTSSVEMFDPMTWTATTIYTPYVMDLTTGEYTKYEDCNAAISCLCDGGIALAGTARGGLYMDGYVLQNGTATNIIDYLGAIDQQYSNWFRKNMSHEVVTGAEYNEEEDTWEDVIEEILYGGIPVATPDMKKVVVWNDAPWDWDLIAQAVFIDLSKSTSVNNLTVNASTLALDGAGNLKVADGVRSVDIYDLTGACVMSVTNPAGTLSIPLEHGIYVAKVIDAAGVVSTVKIAK